MRSDRTSQAKAGSEEAGRSAPLADAQTVAGSRYKIKERNGNSHFNVGIGIASTSPLKASNQHASPPPVAQFATRGERLENTRRNMTSQICNLEFGSRPDLTQHQKRAAAADQGSGLTDEEWDKLLEYHERKAFNLEKEVQESNCLQHARAR